MSAADSVSLDQLADDGGGEKRGGLGVGSIKSALILFLSFIFVISDVFTRNVLYTIKSAHKSGQIQPFGRVVQGVVLVLLYVVVTHLAGIGVI